MVWTVFQVGLGGALGAMLRFLTVHTVTRFAGPGFPVAILLANVLGSFAMGVVFVWLGRKGMTHLGPFVMTGVLGGFTTFSAFSLDTVTLYERGLFGQMAAYIGLSVTLSIVALVLGVWLAREVWP